MQEEVQGNREAVPEEIAGVHEEEVAHHEEEQEIPGVDEDAQEDNEAQAMLENAMNAKYGPRSGRYNLRNRRECDYLHLFTMNNAFPCVTPSNHPCARPLLTAFHSSFY